MTRVNRARALLAVSLWVLGAQLGSADASVPPAQRPRRISSQVMDLGRAYPLYMAVGMATLVILPGPVTGIRTGNPESIQYFRPDKPENEVTLVLQNHKAQPTNLILRSGKKIYVFDVVPSQRVHQDVLEVLGDYGGAALADAQAELIDSSDGVKRGSKQ